MKSYLEKNVMEMYSTLNERKSVVVERFIIILQNKIYQKKCMLINQMTQLINIKIHIIAQIKDKTRCKLNTYINSCKEIKSKVGDIVRISKYKSIFGKGYVPNRSG